MTSLKPSPSIGQLNLSKGSGEVECKLESASPAKRGTSKLHGFLAERTSPTESALFKPTNCDFNECETVEEVLCTRQSQRPLPWTSSPIVRTNTALVLAEPTDATNRIELDRNRCKTLDLVSDEPDGIEDDPFCGTARPTDVKMSLAAPKDVRPSSAMDRIKRLFNPHSKRHRDNLKEVGGNALAKGDERVRGGQAAAKGQEGNQRKRGDHIVNKTGSVPLGMNAVLELDRNRIRTTEDLDNRGDNVRRERSRNNRIGGVDSATGGGHSKQNWRHGWMFKRQKKSGEASAVVDVHSGQDAKIQKGTMLSACLVEAPSTSPADEATPNIALCQKIHGEDVLNSEMVDNVVGSAPRISPTNVVRCLGKRRDPLPEGMRNQTQEASSSRDRAGNHSSEGVAVKSLARIQSIENVERWLMHGYQAPPRRTKSRQHLSRRSRRNYLYYMSSHNRSSISSSEYAISPTNDRHRCAWEHCQSEKDFDSNDSYKKDEHCCEPSCNDVNVKSKKVVSHEGTLFDADRTARDGETMHLGVGLDACDHHHPPGDSSLSKLNPSLLQFVAELIEGLEKAKHNESEWSTRFLEKTSIPALPPRATNLAEENLPSTSRKHCCSRSSTEYALNPASHEAHLLQNQNAEEPTNGTDGCQNKPNIAGPSDEVPICPGTHCVGLNLNSCNHGIPSEKLRKGGILNRPASLSGSAVLHRCTVEQKRTFSLDKLLDDFNSLNIDSRLPPQLNKLLPLGRASPSLLRRCLLQSVEGRSEILSSRQVVLPATASRDNVFQLEKTDIVCQKPFAQLSADGFSFYADGQKIQYNILDQPDPTEVLEEVRLVAQDAKTLQQNTTEILEHVINLQWKKIRSLQSALSEEQAKRQEAERKLEQLTSHPTEGGVNNDGTAQLTS